MNLLNSLLSRIRSLPSNALFVFVTYLGVVFSLTSRTPTEPPVSDFAYYVDMANGLPAPDPFGKRILVPFIASLFGGSPLAFHYMNIIFVALASLLLYLSNKGGDRGFIVGILFLTGTRAITIYAGEPSPDGMIYLLIALTIYLVEIQKDWLFVIVAPLAAATHPIAFVITTIVWSMQNYKEYRKFLLLVPGVLVFLWLLPQSYGTLYLPDLSRILWMARSITVLWLGLLALRKNKESLLVLFVIIACFGFSLLATNVDRVFAPIGLFLAPMFVRVVFFQQESSE